MRSVGHQFAQLFASEQDLVVHYFAQDYIKIQLLQEERLQGATLLVLANKQDLAGAANPEEIRKLLNLGKFMLTGKTILLFFRKFEILSDAPVQCTVDNPLVTHFFAAQNCFTEGKFAASRSIAWLFTYSSS